MDIESHKYSLLKRSRNFFQENRLSESVFRVGQTLFEINFNICRNLEVESVPGSKSYVFSFLNSYHLFLAIFYFSYHKFVFYHHKLEIISVILVIKYKRELWYFIHSVQIERHITFI